MRRLLHLALVALPAVLATPALAGPAAERTAAHLYDGTLEAGDGELSVLAMAGDPEAEAGLGVIRFARAIERFAQTMYRHGLQPGGASYGPFLRMPLPPNPNPEPLSYEQLRDAFAAVSADLDAAEQMLAEVGDREVKLPLATGRIRIDINGDGRADENEQLLALAFGDSAPAEFRQQNESFVVAFDTADVYWLRGYCNLLGAVADFWLSFDFREAFNQTFHVIFPKAGLPNQAALATGSNVEGFDADGIADTIALIHLARWPVTDRARFEGLRTRFLKVIELNRKTWAAVAAETDNDREWLPSVTQKTGVMGPGFEITQERVDAWLAALTEMEDVLEGRKLMPHWRFRKGFNLKRAFSELQTFDLVLWVTGQGVLPFLEDGPVADGAAFAQADRVFTGDLLTYAFWFN
ncbi:MAG: hypothetical protein IT548_16015 [Alphaproteobacteria bacterium]|nr:hypothetical protein [Alphaproteobacteria bacterium]